jgi:ribonuclease BN (tRNA processing enzyme)
MRFIFLGTNGWYDTETGNTTCTLIETNDSFVVLDAGNGFYKLDDYISDISKKPIYLFLSHFHLDHIIGLHILNKFNFKNGISIYGQSGTGKILDTIINQPYTVPFAKLPFKVNIYEISERRYDVPFPFECKFLVHASKCLGYRFELDGKIIAYCTDTGICENAIKLAEDADLLITECSLKRGQDNEPWPHLTPDDAVKIAKEAKAKNLALTHFDANIYRFSEERMVLQKEMEKIFENIIFAYDDLELNI